MDLRREWQGMAPHPEFVYRFIDEQYGLRYMSIWRLKCHGQKFLKRGAVYGRQTDCWVAQYDRLLWRGAAADSLGGAQRRGREDPDRIFVAPKNQTFTSLEETLVAFEVIRDRHLSRYQDDIRRWQETITKLRGEVGEMEALIDRMTGFVPPLR